MTIEAINYLISMNQEVPKRYYDLIALRDYLMTRHVDKKLSREEEEYLADWQKQLDPAMQGK